MTLSSSLNAGVAGLTANASRLGAISDNIANASTFGYKRARTDFHSMVNAGNAGGTYAAGGVRVISTRLVEERGTIVSTSNPTDIAIAGRGMIPVAQGSALGNGAPQMLLTSTGSFRPAPNGLLTSDTGLVLLGFPANPDGTLPAFSRDSAAGLRPVDITANQFVGNPTTELAMQLNLPANATRAGAPGDPLGFSMEYYSNLGTAERLDIALTPDVPDDGDPPTNRWTLHITNPADGDATVLEVTLEFDDSPLTGGMLASVTPAAAYDADSGRLSFALDGKTVTLDIGRPLQPDGVTQLSDTFSIIEIDRNGAPAGNLVSVEISEQGMLHGVYEGGHRKLLYQIPVADVPAPNGLAARDNQTFAVTPASGPFYLWNAGEGPTGAMMGYAREESATDVAQELTQMIQTQRAYSSSAKIIQTVDELLQETTNLKR